MRFRSPSKRKGVPPTNPSLVTVGYEYRSISAMICSVSQQWPRGSRWNESVESRHSTGNAVWTRPDKRVDIRVIHRGFVRCAPGQALRLVPGGIQPLIELADWGFAREWQRLTRCAVQPPSSGHSRMYQIETSPAFCCGALSAGTGMARLRSGSLHGGGTHERRCRGLELREGR